MSRDDKDEKPRLVADTSFSKKPTQRSLEDALSPLEPMRTLEELHPIVQQAAEKPELMKQFREAAGSEDQARATAAIDAITEFAQSIDPTVTRVEGVRITVGLMKMVGHRESPARAAWFETPLRGPHREGQLLNVPLRSLKRSSRPGARTSGVAEATLPHNSCTVGEIGCERSPAWNNERKIGSDDAEAVCDVAATGVTAR
jgi:hypothetical protein